MLYIRRLFVNKSKRIGCSSLVPILILIYNISTVSLIFVSTKTVQVFFAFMFDFLSVVCTLQTRLRHFAEFKKNTFLNYEDLRILTPKITGIRLGFTLT